MPGPGQKVISKHILPIFIGGLASILVQLGLICLFAEREFSDLVINLIAFFIPAMAGGFVTTFFFAKIKFIHSILTAIVFMIGIIIPEIIDFSLEVNYSKRVDAFFFKAFIIILVAAMLGGYVGILTKKRKTIV